MTAHGSHFRCDEMLYLCTPHKYIVIPQTNVKMDKVLDISDGAVAHRLEQAAHNHLVVGSIPTSPTIEIPGL